MIPAHFIPWIRRLSRLMDFITGYIVIDAIVKIWGVYFP